MIIYLRNKNYVHKISSKTSTLYNFHIKIYLESFVSIYHLFVICIIYLESSVKVFSKTWTWHWTTGSSVKTIISGVTLSEIAPCVPGISIVWHSFWFFSVLTISEITFCIFTVKCFSCSNSFVLLSFLARHYSRWYESNGEIVKRWIAATIIK